MDGGLELDRDGAEHQPAALSAADLDGLIRVAERLGGSGAGTRVFGEPALDDLLGLKGSVGRLARDRLGPAARPVRAVLFDKSQACNWAVAWHQDRVVAVKTRVDVEGFGPWSTKAGVLHVMPPFDVLDGMLTLRLHLDACDEDNAALLVACGSHRLGRVVAEEASLAASRCRIVPCCAQAGDVWLYRTPVLHASERARAVSRRRVIQVDYAAAQLPGGLEWLGV
jgi:hypothetical protein